MSELSPGKSQIIFDLADKIEGFIVGSKPELKTWRHELGKLLRGAVVYFTPAIIIGSAFEVSNHYREKRACHQMAAGKKAEGLPGNISLFDPYVMADNYPLSYIKETCQDRFDIGIQDECLARSINLTWPDFNSEPPKFFIEAKAYNLDDCRVKVTDVLQKN